MVTTIVNPAPQSESNNGIGFLLGVILIVIFAGILLYYGIPYMRSSLGGPQVTVPSKIDVNVHNSK